MRKLASIRKIDDIRPIEGADAIECAVVGGWTVVVKKGEYQAGDLAVYCEIDSFIPSTIAAFLTKPERFPMVYEGVEGERLRTIRLRKQLSQGLLLPLEPTCANIASELFEGLDVSFPLGILKYEAPIPAQLAGEARGMFPSFVPKTDQERIQNMTGQIAEWREQNLTFELTEKLDGSSMTVYVRDGEAGVCSRNLDLRETEFNSLWMVARREKIIEAIQASGMNLAVQGELIGEGIQGNPYKIKGQEFHVFDVYSIDQGKYLTPEKRRAFCEQAGIKHTPVLTVGKDLGVGDVHEILLWAEDKSRLNDKTEREGLVFKCEQNAQLSFKAISNRFLLKGGN